MAIKEKHNFGRSVKAKLLNVSRNEKLGYQMLVTRYLQERLLYRLSISPYHNHFLLKGGALLYAHKRFMGMKDFYDLYTILHEGKYDSEVLSEAINATFENRQTAYMDNHTVFSLDFANNSDLNIRWNSFVTKLKIQQKLAFPEVVCFLQARLEPYWKMLK